MSILISVLIDFLVVILVLYLINLLPLDGRARQIVRTIVIIIGILFGFITENQPTTRQMGFGEAQLLKISCVFVPSFYVFFF